MMNYRKCNFPGWRIVLVCLSALFLTNTTFAETKRKIRFNRDVRPILSENCFTCHGADEKSRRADLRLDLAESAIRDIKAIVPGNGEKSELYLRILGKEGHRIMPPRKTRKTLTNDEIQILKDWIDQGAEFQGHWAFEAPTRPELPKVQNPQWTRSPIDYFILAQLESEKLSPSPEADKRTLIRRVTFDLTGLPPTPEEVEAFVNDSSSDAYSKVVDRLLASPQFGEHKARYWLDAIRYGDTHGLHLDNYREMWPFRDWVIRAYNENKRFDQFTLEQIAGDLLPNPTLDQLTASGYNRAHVTTNEGGSIAEEVYVRNVIDRVSTTATVWMGLTSGCAVCHDHKFDPIKQKEFYQMFAFFNNVDGSSMDGNRKDPAPVARVPTLAQRMEQSRLSRKIASRKTQMQQRGTQVSAEYEKWLEKAQAKDTNNASTLEEGLFAHYALDEGKGNVIVNAREATQKGSVKGSPLWTTGKHTGGFQVDDKRYLDLGNVADFERTDEFSYGLWVKWSGRGGGSSPLSRMNDGNAYRGYDIYVANGQVAVHVLHSWPTKLAKVTSRARIKPNQWTHLFVTYNGSSRASGIKLYFNGKLQPVVVNNDTLAAPIPDNLKPGQPIPNSIRTKVELRLGRRNPGSPFFGVVDDARFYNRRLSPQEVSQLAGTDPIAPILALAPEKRNEQQRTALRNYYLNNQDPVYSKLKGEMDQAQELLNGLSRLMPTTLVMKERAAPREAFLLKRGQYDLKGEKVDRKTPEFLPAMPKDAPVNRLGFAQWLLDPQHPLTTRVAVNRMWQQVFGTGIVKTSEDFGTQGELPSHPDLLDWLAVEFRESGWDVKRMTKLIVTSATYRQSSKVTPELELRDPTNRLLARGPRFRLDAEALRDQALSVSGLLVREMNGPSVKPPQPKGLWYAVGYTSSNTARFKADAGSKIYRRSVYTFWKRTSPPPQMATFDAPSREACTVRRERTNTPLQALLLMNERQYVESARNLAQRMMREGGTTPESRIQFAFQLLVARKADPMEVKELSSAYLDFLKEMQADVKGAAELIKTGDTPPDATLDKSELAAWTLVANLMLNLDEVLTKE